jgi:6-phosphogluconolactonase
MTPEVVILADAQAVAAAAADRVVAAARATKGHPFHIALAGGSTPKATYALLAAPPRRDQVDWSAVEVFFGDERCVPPDHPDSNFGMAKRTLLDQVSIPRERVHRIAGERPPAEAAAGYEAELRATLGKGGRFDLVLLGMGPDGHTASLFPGTTALAERAKWVAPNFVPHLDAWRVTLTFPVLCAANTIVVSAPGGEKADALHAALKGAPEAVPIKLVRPTSGTLTYLVDRAAASRL